MIPGVKVAINIHGLPPGIRGSVPAPEGIVRKVTWNQVFVIDVPGRAEPLLCDACDIAVLPEAADDRR